MKKPRVVLLLLALSTLAACSSYGFGWGLVNGKVHRDFPEVKRITTAELAAWLNDPARRAPLLLDVRTPAEYAVSHLEHARQIDPAAAASAVEAMKDRPIVTYCSVGYRSAALAKRLQDAGYTQVWNLEGSIFQWANERRPIYRDGQRVTQVHPYNNVWGLLLKKRYRADLPENP